MKPDDDKSIVRNTKVDEPLVLKDVTSIRQIWEAAKKFAPTIDNNVLRYVYRFKGNELVYFTWELSVFIEDTPGYDEFYAENLDTIKAGITAAHNKGHMYPINKPDIL